MPKQKGYLHTCLALHSELTEILYKRRQDIKKIEKATAQIRSSRRLAYEDLKKILDREVWNADMFGYWPQRQEIEPILESTDWDFWNLPKKEEKAIADLLAVFHQIEPVSVIMRFIAPQEYGIISPPVEKVLGINSFGSHSENHRTSLRNPHLEKYRTYLNDLRNLKEVKGFSRAADVDMALWVLQMGVLEERLKGDENYDALREGFWQDAELRKIQVRNLTGRLFDESVMSRLELAEALVVTDVRAAGQIAGIEFERSMIWLARAKPSDKKPSDDLNGMVEVIQDRSDLDEEFKISCKEAVKTRNKAMHPPQTLTKQAVERLIGVVRAVEKMKKMG